jgi:hypothetical protein
LGLRPSGAHASCWGGIELMHMIKKGQLKDSGNGQTPADRFYSLTK